MKNRMWFALFLMLLIGTGWTGMVYGYWTDRLDTSLTLHVIHPVEIVILEKTKEGDFVIASDSSAGAKQ